MASAQKVKTYLAYWFQLGKPVVFHNSQAEYLPCPIFQGTEFSPAFERCWQRILQRASECYLQGTDETIAALLSDEWDIAACARCPMPRPLPVRQIFTGPCPCSDLPAWPNDEVPSPRMGVSSHDHLDSIRERLVNHDQTDRDRIQSAYFRSPSFPEQPAVDSADHPDHAEWPLTIRKRLEKPLRDGQ